MKVLKRARGFEDAGRQHGHHALLFGARYIFCATVDAVKQLKALAH
jgi:type VI protein secretion system component VasF